MSVKVRASASTFLNHSTAVACVSDATAVSADLTAWEPHGVSRIQNIWVYPHACTYSVHYTTCCVCYTCGPNLRSVFDISVLDGLWRLCSKYKAPLGWTPRPFSVSACFTGRFWAGGQRRLVNIAETAIGPRVQPRDALHLLQRRQRRSSLKVIQLDDFKT